MASAPHARVLMVADTHLGFDLPFRPRIQRRRRGPDFFANFKRALKPALDGEIDLVVHGGDLFFRSKVPAPLVEMAMAPLLDVARRGVKVFIVPGNHERSRIPSQLWTTHKNIHIFHKPGTIPCAIEDRVIAVAGFPFARGIRDAFTSLTRRTGRGRIHADAALLCIHQTVEGARVGAGNYTFREGPDIIRGRDVPSGFAAILAGHIHRSQVITRDLQGASLNTPVIYPGSVERTSFAERREAKHYARLRIGLGGPDRGKLIHTDFVPLPTRPMAILRLAAGGSDAGMLMRELKRRLRAMDPDAVVCIRIEGMLPPDSRDGLSIEKIRELAPPGMNVSLAPFSSPAPRR